MTIAPPVSRQSAKQIRRPENTQPENLIVSIIFLVVLVQISACAYVSDSAYQRVISFRENRYLERFPRISSLKRDLEKFPSQFEAYFNDYFPFRFPITAARSRILYSVFNTSANPSMCAIGKNHRLFLTFGKAQSAQCNLDPFAPGRIELWGKMLAERKKELSARGIKYLFVVVPQAGTIYPESLPNGWHRLAGKSRLEKLQDYLKEKTDIDFVDLRSLFLAAKENGLPLYYTNDGHWNEYGGFLAVQEALAHIGKEFPGVHPFRADQYRLTPAVHKGDLARTLCLEDLLLDKESPHVALPEPLSSHLNPRAKLPAAIKDGLPDWCTAWQSNDKSLPRALILHDSFMTPMQPYLSQKFSYAEYQFAGYPLPALVFSQKPDIAPNIVIEELCERYIYEREPGVTTFLGPPPDSIRTQPLKPLATFDGKLVLESIHCTDDESGLIAKLVWHSKDKVKLDKMVRVHLIDSRTKKSPMYIDYRQDLFERTVEANSRWVDTVSVPKVPDQKTDQFGVLILRDSTHFLNCVAEHQDYNVRVAIPIKELL